MATIKSTIQCQLGDEYGALIVKQNDDNRISIEQGDRWLTITLGEANVLMDMLRRVVDHIATLTQEPGQ